MNSPFVGRDVPAWKFGLSLENYDSFDSSVFLAHASCIGLKHVAATVSCYCIQPFSSLSG